MIRYVIILMLIMSACNSNTDDLTEQVNKTLHKPPKWAQHFNSDWASNDLWNDGLAEVNIYDAERVIYGESRKYEQVYIAVKETFNKEYHVKTDNYERNDLFDVIKVNLFADIPTHKYPYHYLMSIFFKRELPYEVNKLTVSSQEWCGNTFKAIRKKNYGYDETYNSYWDGEGKGDRKINQNCLIEDQLIFTLRSLNFRDGFSFTAPIMKTRMTSKATAPNINEARITITDNDTSWKVVVKGDHIGEIIYLVEKEYPNKLTSMIAADGRKWDLKSSSRDDYWAD
ncbi:hypothetical protein [Marinigracilibium pacificum]|uniref:Uncharacterized protein n=1 Tax=Marinigracilibium pacificum TaxID=2729599 RepID=A0A848IYD4_9BACT|nr:hypothetical protein [Marinigracilibium pacificum]NMM49513.1 hypothetical protein [Marinigracilibium pacificum]